MFTNGLKVLALAISLAMCGVAAVGQKTAGNAPLKLNQIQVIGTHNSYHAGIAPSEATLWQAKRPDIYQTLDYRHPALAEQFDGGVRQIELDIYADAAGGRFAHPAGPQIVAQAQLPPDPAFDPNGVFARPGFKVMHVQDFDYRSVCQPFKACLEEVRRWSQAHPEHTPIFILVEAKRDSEEGGVQLTPVEPFTPAAYDALDAEILSVFKRDELVVPDDVRGNYATLNQAVLAGNWPTLASARGKIVFLLEPRWSGKDYLVGHPSLRGRLLFTNAEPGQPDAAYTECNEGPAETITALVRQGYLVRARSDADTAEARANDTRRRDAMLQSGAQIVSTDYPASEPARWEGHYTVTLPGNADARCNPVNTPVDCQIK